jgi:hypothetical protein
LPTFFALTSSSLAKRFGGRYLTTAAALPVVRVIGHRRPASWEPAAVHRDPKEEGSPMATPTEAAENVVHAAVAHGLLRWLPSSC